MADPTPGDEPAGDEPGTRPDPQPDTPSGGDQAEATRGEGSPAAADENTAGENTATDDEAETTSTQNPATEDQAGADVGETSAVDTASPVAAAGGPGGTTPAWWTWVGGHRKLVAIVAAVVVVGVVATLVVVSVLTPGPTDVVQRYLDAIQRGDTEAALAIAGEPEELGLTEILDKEALVDGWKVDAVVERPQDENDVDVDVTFSAGGVSRQGRFSMVKDENGWRMEEPFVRVDLMVGSLDSVELGGVRAEAATARNGLVSLLVFPGVYELYPSLAKRVSFEPKVFVAAPQENGDVSARIAVTPTLTDAGKKEAQKSMNAYTDECLKQPSLDPSGCPFSAKRIGTLRDFAYVDDITWKIVSYPEAHFATGNDGGFQLVTRKVGTVQLTAVGTPEDGAQPVNFTTTCEFGFTGMDVALTMDGFVTTASSRNVLQETTTVCF